jgi:protein TonB
VRLRSSCAAAVLALAAACLSACVQEEAKPVSSVPGTRGTPPAPLQAVTAETPAQKKIASAYRIKVVEQLGRHIPEVKEGTALGGSVVLRLVIARNGDLIGADIARSSGNPALDQLMKTAALAASPYPPVPDDLPGAYFSWDAPIKAEPNDRGQKAPLQLKAAMPPTPEQQTPEQQRIERAYLAKVVEHLTKQRFEGSAEEHKRSFVLRLVIARNGRVISADIARSSGNPELDRKVKQVALAATPFPPLPDELPGPSFSCDVPLRTMADDGPTAPEQMPVSRP